VYLVRSLGAHVTEWAELPDPFDYFISYVSGGYDAVFLVDDGVISYTLPDNVENLVIQGTLATTAVGNASANNMYGNNSDNALDGGAGADMLNGGAGRDTLIGGADNDIFVFRAGQADGDIILDFAGNGAAAGDSLKFVGYGAGATFAKVDATHWQVNYHGGASHELITFANGASVDPSDVLFV